MREFSFGNAWTFGLRFFAGRALSHAIILLGCGILLPLALQFLLVGQLFGYLAPPPMDGGAMDPTAGVTGWVVLAMSAGYVLQLSSFFASWRLGFDRDASLAGALLFGLLAGLAAGVAFGIVFGLFGFGFAQLAPVAGIIAGFIAAFLLLCLLLTMPAAMLAAGISLFLGLAMILGTAVGNVGLAATLVGGSGFLVVILLILSGLFTWLAGRFSCTIPLMIEHRNFNLFAAAAESWRLTWDDEWRIMRYLGIVGILAAIVVMVVAIGLGAGAAAISANSPELALRIAAAILQVALILPIAYLTVLVPAGIYRELAGTSFSAEVFA